MNEQSVNSPGAYNKLYSSPVYVALYCISVPVLAKNILKKKKDSEMFGSLKKKTTESLQGHLEHVLSKMDQAYLHTTSG